MITREDAKKARLNKLNNGDLVCEANNYLFMIWTLENGMEQIELKKINGKWE